MTIAGTKEWFQDRNRVREHVMSLEECRRCNRITECHAAGGVKLPLTDPPAYQALWLCSECDSL
jgi:hypothetical protein